VIRTRRLVLRRWRAEDRAPFAALNADPEVMAHFPSPLDPAASDALVARIEAHHDAHGFGLWAVEGPEGLVGTCGLQVPPAGVPAGAPVELGWRLARTAWGRGYATEAGTASLHQAFDVLGLPAVAAFTAAANERSQAVMRRLGLPRVGEFDHPALPEGHRLRRHVLHRAERETWVRPPAAP
jgi:RimJ/RimL family protein N-acetyltransferase